MAASGTQHPLLLRRIVGEARQIARVKEGLARRVYLLPFSPASLVGIDALGKLT